MSRSYDSFVNQLTPLAGSTMATERDMKNRPELAIRLYDKLKIRDAEISNSLGDFELFIPSSTADDASHASWKMNGTVAFASLAKISFELTF
ncbi:MAG: hypothetical protein ABI557_18285 [Aureliella sp.]